MGVYAVYALFEGDIFGFGGQEFGIIASVFEVCYDSSGDFAGVGGFEEFAVGAAFAGGVLAVAVVDEDEHRLSVTAHDSFAKV